MADGIPIFIQKLMTAAGWTQTGLAREAHVAQSTVSKWLDGTHSPNIEQWARVMRAAAKNPKTRHLVDTASKLHTETPEASIDDMVRPYGPDVYASIRGIVADILKTLPNPPK